MPYLVAGMSDCYKDALLCFKSKLKENVDLKTGLEDKLPIAAGGFMSQTEAHYVAQLPGYLDQMGTVVDCLCKKRDEDFFTFLKMLKDTNNGHWADALLAKAKEFKRETVKGTQYTYHTHLYRDANSEGIMYIMHRRLRRSTCTRCHECMQHSGTISIYCSVVVARPHTCTLTPCKEIYYIP